MRKSILLVAVFVLAAVLFTDHLALSADCVPVPQIVKQLPRYARGWVGSACWHDGIIYEVTDSTAGFALLKDAETGTEFGRMHFSGMGDMQGISYDPWNDTWWVKPHGLQGAIEYDWAGGKTGRSISTRSYAAQIYVDPDERDVIWVGHSVKTGILKINTTNDELLQQIPTAFGVRSVVRVGDDFWCSRAAEVGQKGVLIKVNSYGDEICRYYMPRAKYEHDTGGCSLDDEGYLWVEGGKETSIYRIDIGYQPSVKLAVPVIDSGDYNGDGISDLAIYRPASGLWAIRDVTRVYFGTARDIPASGDYNGDGTTDIALFRPGTGLWATLNSGRAYFGTEGDIPVPGDYNGNGTVTPAIFRPATGLWAVRNLSRAYFGSPGDIPVPYYNHLGEAKQIAIFRPTTGLWASSSDRKYFGSQDDQPVIGSYGPGQYEAQPAVFRQASGLWAVKEVTRAYFGMSGDQPVPGNYTGVTKADIGIFRQTSGLWGVKGVTRAYFGSDGDIPVSGFSINPSSAQNL